MSQELHQRRQAPLSIVIEGSSETAIPPVIVEVSVSPAGGYWRHMFKLFRYYVLHLNHFRIHLIYFLALGLVGSLVIWGFEYSNASIGGPIAFEDALFTAYSAISETGLVVLDSSLLRPGSMVTIGLLMQAGSFTLISMVPLLVRRHWYRKLYGRKVLDERQIVIPKSLDPDDPDYEAALTPFEAQVLEYRGMRSMLVIVALYQLIPYLIAFAILAPYLTFNPHASQVLRENHVSSAPGCALFLIIAAYNNAGFTPFSLNMIPFQSDTCVLITLSFLMLLGFTFFPIGVRCIVYFMWRFSKDKEPYGFMLAHPRRVYTYLFPTLETVYLALALFVVTVAEYAISLALDFHLPVLATIEPRLRFMTTWFQAVATRTCGFNAYDISLTSPTLQFLQMVLMYLAAIPVRWSLRATSKKSPNDMMVERARSEYHLSTGKKSIARQFFNFIIFEQSFMMSDLMLLFICTMIIMLTENTSLFVNNFVTVFNVMYEVASAYGTVGLSLGYPGTVTSLSAIFGTGAKLVMCAICLIGRHRGLPEALDATVRAPDRHHVTDSETCDVGTAMTPRLPIPQSLVMAPSMLSLRGMVGEMRPVRRTNSAPELADDELEQIHRQQLDEAVGFQERGTSAARLSRVEEDDSPSRPETPPGFPRLSRVSLSIPRLDLAGVDRDDV
eukprot:TRINITY_DN3894_c0_g1_i2.p1 TRINITY_DN3894_c0_g1~~TRINITY_DN3894_c0_g1_i2.p1  ORF type:complete len:670 (-),score=92.42 TRINITY_DN3894_c0_g1_i2:8-2017(-)